MPGNCSEFRPDPQGEHEARHRDHQADVLDALMHQGISGMTLTELKGYGRQKGHTEIYRGAEYVVNFLPKIRVEVAVNDDQADRVVTAIQTAAKTGRIGDGKIFVMPLDHALRVRTGETDRDAL
jgi:nitrogen regulatory protein P-II 2